jgi:PBP1b-binding outer membrane lipoprotein LpoB
MNYKWNLTGILLIFAILLVGCSNTTVQPQESTSKTVEITMSTNPPMPTVGVNELVINLRNEKNQPITGAEVNISADHIEMSGMTMSGLATEQENGNYAITADFSMSGMWKITIVVQKEGVEYKKDLDLKIQ